MRKVILSTLAISLILLPVHSVAAAQSRSVENATYSGLAYIFSGIIGLSVPTSISYAEDEATLVLDGEPPLVGEYGEASLGPISFWSASFPIPGGPPFVLNGLDFFGFNAFFALGSFGAFILGLTTLVT